MFRSLIKRFRSTTLLATLLLLLAACGGGTTAEPTLQPTAPPLPDTPTAAPPTAVPDTPTPTDPVDTSTGTAFIEALDVTLLESSSGQVQVTVQGNLSDGCTTIAAVNEQKNGDLFNIQITTNRDPNAICTQALVPFTEVVILNVANLPAGDYTVTAGDLRQTFTLTDANAGPLPTPDLSDATLTIAATATSPGQLVTLTGNGFPADSRVEIGIGPINSEYDIIGEAITTAAGQFTTEIAVPNYAEVGEEWVFVADLNNAKVIADPILISDGEASGPTPTPAVNEPINGRFTRTQMYLVAQGDNGQNGQHIGCDDSIIPVTIDIEPTVAPLTAALNQMFSMKEQFYGQSGLYNVFYQSDLSVTGIDIVEGEAIIALAGTFQVAGICDEPRVMAQLQQTALQYDTVTTVMVTINGEPLEMLLSSE